MSTRVPNKYKSHRTPLRLCLALSLLTTGMAPVGARAAADPESQPRVDARTPSAGSSAPATTAWNSLRAALDDGFRPALESLPQLVGAIADLPYEVLLVFDREGQFIFYAEGERHQVDIPRRRITQLRGGTLLHNHPSATPPSGVDYKTLCRHALRESIVAARVEGIVVQARIALRGEGLHTALRRCEAGTTSTVHAPWTPVAFEPERTWAAEPRDRLAQVAYGMLGSWL